MLVVDAVTAYTSGMTGVELERSRYMAEKGWQSGAELRAALGPQMSELLDSGLYPNFGRYVEEGKDKEQFEERFFAGLDLLLDGIERRHLATGSA